MLATSPPYFEDPSPPMGLVCERGPVLSDERRAKDDPVWLVPFESAVVKVEHEATGSRRAESTRSITVDGSSIVLLPAGARHVVSSTSALPHLVTLSFSAALRARTVEEYRGEIDGERLETFVRAPARLPRTAWLNELCHRYVFERTVCHKHTSGAARFMEVELTKELYFLCVEQAARCTRASFLEETSPTVARAIEHIERHLFTPLDVKALARRCGVSTSTLLRSFKRAVGSTPSAYARRRRLDEARLLLQSGRYAVGEVAMLVGYQNVASFTHAFHRYFGQPPSSLPPRSGP